MDVQPGQVRLDVAGTIAWLTLDQPVRHNAMSLAMWRELPECIAAAVANPAVRVIAVRGAGERAFCSGADISEFKDNRSDESSAAAYDEAVHRGLAALRQAAKPTVAVVRGICFGGGLEIALCCDLRIASSGTRFRVPAGRLGLGYGYRNIALLLERLGRKVATEILYTASTIAAGKALADGILHQAFAEETFDADSAAYLGSVAGNAPLVLKAMKIAFIEMEKPASDRDISAVDRVTRSCVTSQDYREGQLAFRERREPRFIGR